MYGYIVLDSSTSWEEFLESIFKFPHLLIRGLVKGLSTNEAIYSATSIRMYCNILRTSRTPWDEFVKSILNFLTC